MEEVPISPPRLKGPIHGQASKARWLVWSCPQGQKGRGNRPKEWKECSGVEWNSGALSSIVTQLNLVMSTLGLSLLICQMERVIFNLTPLRNALGILLSLNIQHSVLISL